MQHTLVAVFDNRTDATNAMNELLSSNFTRQNVQLSDADQSGMTGSASAQSDVRSADSDSGLGAGITNFFSDLFGADNSDHASRYEGAVSGGRHVLTVTAESLPEVERAADIVERYGPTDIDEQATGASGMSGMSGASGMAGSMPMGAATGIQQSQQMSLQSGNGPGSNLQLDNAGDRKLFQQQSLNQAEPMGTTYQEPMGKSGLSATGGTSLHASTLQENSVQGSALEGTQQSGTSIYSSGQQGGTLQGSALEGSVQQGAMPGAMQRDTLAGSDPTMNLGSQQRDLKMETGTMQGAAAQTIPVLEERLNVGKREVQRGGVRIYSRVVETPVNESIGLRQEHVDVQRRPVDQPISPLDAVAFKEQTIEMRETAEEAVIEKSARIVEEVTIGKEVSQRQEQITDTLRHTEVEVERLDGGSAMSDTRDDDSYFRSHFSSTYGDGAGSYDDYAPAYSYGSQMGRSEMYRNRPWDEVEPTLRSDWDTRYGSGGQSTWEKMKSAVRHGWDRVKS